MNWLQDVAYEFGRSPIAWVPITIALIVFVALLIKEPRQ